MTLKNAAFDWEDEWITKWFAGKSNSTKRNYRIAWKDWIEFRGLDPKEAPESLVNEKWEDVQKPPTDKTKGFVEQRVRGLIRRSVELHWGGMMGKTYLWGLRWVRD